MKATTKRLLKEYVRPYVKLFMAAIACMFVAAAATASFPYFLKPAFDLMSSNDFNMILICSMIFAAFCVKGLASYGESFLMLYVGQKIIFDIQQKLFQHLLTMDLQFFNKTANGDILSRFANDATLMRTAVATTIVGIGKDFLTFICLAFVMFYRDFTLAIFAFIVFPSIMIPVFIIGRKIKKIMKKTQEDLGIFSGYLMQVFHGIKIVKSYCMEKIEANKVKQKIDKLMQLSVKAYKAKSIMHPISECICGIAIVLVILYGGHQISTKEQTIGDLISFLCALLLCYDPLKKLTNLSANLQEGIAAAERIFEIIDIKPKICNISSPIILNEEIRTIEFCDVCFGYGDKLNLQHINFKINKGETVAFVGESGSGKSTIINLLNRFYDITDGLILINGIDIKKLDLAFLRSQIAIVTQENILFNVSFYDNILYGKLTATKEDVENVARSALAHDFIMKTPNQYQTIIEENGTNISGGQRQRIAIARALLKNSPILLLDEATSALDTKSEKIVQKALDNLIKDRTTIVVAHRISSIINANKIYVVSDGQILEQGTHEDLLKLGKIYSKLWYHQLSKA